MGEPNTIPSLLRLGSKDTAYWRRVLASASTTLPKVLATTFVDRNYALLSEIAAKYRSDQHLTVRVKPMLTPLSMAERDWEQPFTHVFQVRADGYRNLSTSFITNIREVILHKSDGNQSDWEVKKIALLSPFLYRPHATVNVVHHRWKNVLLAAAAPGDKFLDAIRQVVDANATIAQVPRGLAMIDNYVGKSLAAAETADSYLASYVARVHNLEGRMRLVQMQLELYRQHVPAEAIEGYLEQSPAELRDPYLKKPMHWDSATRELWFDGIDSKSKSKIPELNHRITAHIY